MQKSAEIDLKDPEQKKDLLEGAGTLGLAGLGVQQFMKARKLRDTNVVGVTSGHLDTGILNSATGSGHVTPMAALEELLSKHEAFKKKEFILDRLVRRNEGKKHIWDHKLKDKGVKSWLGTVETGFGGTMYHNPFSRLKNSPIYHNPYGQTLFVPDPMPKDHEFMMTHRLRNANVLDRLLGGAKQDLVTFGPDDPYTMYPHRRRLHNSHNVHPAISSDVLDQARRGLSATKADKKQIIKKLIQHAEANDDKRTANVLRQALQGNKEIHVISGATRGDQVASRAIKLVQALKRRKTLNKSVVLALMGEGKGSDLELMLSEHPNIASFGKLKRDLYLGAQNIGDGHWGSAGATSRAEAMLSRVPTATSVNNNEMKHEELKMLKNIPHYDKKLEKSVSKINLDKWSPGNRRWLKQQAKLKPGIGAVRNVQEYLKFYEKSKKVPKEQILARVQEYITETQQEQKLLADRLVAKFRAARRMTGYGRNIARGVGGLSLLGAGYLGSKLIGRHLNKKNDSEKTAGIISGALQGLSTADMAYNAGTSAHNVNEGNYGSAAYNAGNVASMASITPYIANRLGANTIGSLSGLGAATVLPSGIAQLGKGGYQLATGQDGGAWNVFEGGMDTLIGGANARTFLKSPVGKTTVRVASPIVRAGVAAAAPIVGDVGATAAGAALPVAAMGMPLAIAQQRGQSFDYRMQGVGLTGPKQPRPGTVGLVGGKKPKTITPSTQANPISNSNYVPPAMPAGQPTQPTAPILPPVGGNLKSKPKFNYTPRG